LIPRIIVAVCCALSLCAPVAAQTAAKAGAAGSTAAGAGVDVPAGSSAPAAGIPFKREPASAESGTYAALVTIGVLFLGIGALLILRRRVAPGAVRAAGKLLRIAEAVNLGGPARLLVVEFEGRALLLAQNRDGVRLLWPAGPERNEPNGTGPLQP